MRINEVKDRHVTISLDASELVSLCNFIYEAKKLNGDNLKPYERELNAQLMTARDLCQYGHVDGFTLRHIVIEKHKANPNPKTEMGRLFEYAKEKAGEDE